MSGIFREPLEGFLYRRRGFAPLVARRSFSRAAHLEIFTEEAWTAQRRVFAPVPTSVIPGVHLAYSPAGRLLASLLAAGVFGDTAAPASRPRAFQLGFAPATGDVGKSASFKVSAGGQSATATVTFTGKGDDAYGPVGLSVAATEALGADTARQLAIQNPAVFGGASASRIV